MLNGTQTESNSESNGSRCSQALLPGSNVAVAEYDRRRSGTALEPDATCHIDVAPWPILGSTAACGIAGEITRLATRKSEADPVAVLITSLVWAGAAFGRKRFLRVGETKHHPRLFSAIVGASSRARKGTSVEPVRRIFQAAEERLTSRTMGTLEFPSGLPLKVVPGPLSSGEGLIHAVRDKSDELEDPGVTDKRLLCIEGELGAVLRVFQRQGNTLSVVLRTAWDGLTLSPLTKHARETASEPHICIVGHITRHELRALMTAPDTWNGFANRFLWAAVRRTKLVPFPETMPDTDVNAIAHQLADVIAYAHGKDGADSEIVLTNSAVDLWCAVYPELTLDHSGILGAVTSRAEAQVLRLALTYSLLDGRDRMGHEHIEAAIAMWRYAFDSARLIFGDSELDPHAQKILDALENRSLTQTEISNLFGRNLKAQQLADILADLQARGRISQAQAGEGRGRRPTVWLKG